MKKITLTRNGQTSPRDTEGSTMHADGLVVGQVVMLRIKGDCCYKHPSEYEQYAVAKIVKSDRFDKKCSDVTFTVAANSGKPASHQLPTTSKPTADNPATLVPEVVPMEATSGVAQQLTTQYRAVVAATGQMLREAVKFGAMLMELEAIVGKSHGGFDSAGDGVKGWLAENCPEINYSTAIVYKNLAAKSATLIGGLGLQTIAALQGGGHVTKTNGETVDVPAEIIEKRDALFEAVDSRRKLEQMYFEFMREQERPRGKKAKGAGEAAIPKLTQREEAAAIWTRVMGVIDKTSVLDAVPLLPQKAAKVCYDRLSELAKAMKSHMEEF